MRIKSEYILLDISDGCVAIPADGAKYDFNEVIRINEAGAFLWKMLAANSEREELIGALSKRYDIGRATAEKDLDVFINALMQSGIVAP
jgi:hypothetical protein